MSTKKTRFGAKWFAGVLMVLFLLLSLGQIVFAAGYGLGDFRLDTETYEKYLKAYSDRLRDAQPASYDARNDGIVTSAKDQGSCGSCWSFACVGAMESHLRKQYAVGPTDLSEQQQVSCNTAMAGCCGGSMTALQWWESQGAIYESCFPYGESSTICPPTYFTVPCSGASGCEQLTYRVIDYHTVAQADFKTSCYEEGPSYWRFDVYDDFHTFWNTYNPGAVYVQSSGSLLGGHAVLIIGWDDAKNAYLCKNSWGATGGPNGDGTFWIAYSGHYHNLGFGMANFDLAGGGCDYCLEDSVGFVWCLNVIDQNSEAIYLSGTVDMGWDFRDAVATFLKKNNGIRMCGATGSGCPFTYNWKLQGSSGTGVWINVQPSPGHGTISVWMCGTASDTEAKNVSGQGQIPGK